MNRYVPKPDLEGINAPPNSPLRDIAFMGFGFIGILAFAFVVLAFAGEWAALKISPEIEKKVFGKFAASIHNLKEIDPLVQAVFLKLQSQTDLDLQLFTICENAPNAFAIPGGAIFVTNGLLKNLKTEMGIAFVLAHEMGHFSHRHHLKGLGRGLGLAAGALFIGLGDSSGMTNTLTDVLSRAYSRDQEAEADKYALDLLMKSYGNLHGTTEFFEMVLKDQTQVEKWASVLGTHPMTEDRLQNIKSRQVLIPRSADPVLNTELVLQDPCK